MNVASCSSQKRSCGGSGRAGTDDRNIAVE
jgi:hypothetical protein